jgi:class 3 adenylate cyclase
VTLARRAAAPCRRHPAQPEPSLGDGLLVEFASPVEATRTALAVRASVLRYRGRVPEAAEVRRELDVRYMLSGCAWCAAWTCSTRRSARNVPNRSGSSQQTARSIEF